MNCVCCGIPLNNDIDTFNDVGLEMCWDCYSELWSVAVQKSFILDIPHPTQYQLEHTRDLSDYFPPENEEKS